MSKPSNSYFLNNFLVDTDDNKYYAKCSYAGDFWFYNQVFGINKEFYTRYKTRIELRNDISKYLTQNKNVKTENSDTGSHYRKTIKLKVTQQECDEGYVEYQLDPYRLANIYNLNDHALFSSLKKILAAGQRGSKDSKRDIEEARDALNRKLEMVKEDKYNE